jgi:hypothetical protein
LTSKAGLPKTEVLERLPAVVKLLVLFGLSLFVTRAAFPKLKFWESCLEIRGFVEPEVRGLKA